MSSQRIIAEAIELHRAESCLHARLQVLNRARELGCSIGLMQAHTAELLHTVIQARGGLEAQLCQLDRTGYAATLWLARQRRQTLREY